MSTGEGKTVCVTEPLVRLLHALLSTFSFVVTPSKPLFVTQVCSIFSLFHHLFLACDPRKTQHLLALEGAEERLKLFKADLLEEGSYDYVVEGCEGVFHTASPFYLDVTDPQAELLNPAVKGTLNVLNSCANTSSVKRVILTSSIAAVTYTGKPRTPDVVVDESWFTDPEYCKSLKLWYVVSKTIAEDSAWKFAKEKGLDLVVINPAMVIGPLLQPTLNTSAAAVLSLIKDGRDSRPPVASYVPESLNNEESRGTVVEATGRFIEE
ncbi:hypothetical protein V6N13_002171 [Hibiscus sabdariffa]